MVAPSVVAGSGGMAVMAPNKMNPERSDQPAQRRQNSLRLEPRNKPEEVDRGSFGNSTNTLCATMESITIADGGEHRHDQPRDQHPDIGQVADAVEHQELLARIPRQARAIICVGA